jgi:hypothetical protein
MSNQSQAVMEAARRNQALKNARNNFSGNTNNQSSSIMKELHFGFKVVNTNLSSADPYKIAIGPALHATVAEMADYNISVDKIMKTGDVSGDGKVVMSPTDENLTIEHFLQFISRGNVKVIRAEIQSNVTTTFDQSIKVGPSNPFIEEKPKKIDLKKYFSQFQNVSTKIVCDFVAKGEAFDLGPLNYAVLPVPGASETYITFTVLVQGV